MSRTETIYFASFFYDIDIAEGVVVDDRDGTRAIVVCFDGNTAIVTLNDEEYTLEVSDIERVFAPNARLKRFSNPVTDFTEVEFEKMAL
jgi:hypothetical protein